MEGCTRRPRSRRSVLVVPKEVLRSIQIMRQTETAKYARSRGTSGVSRFKVGTNASQGNELRDEDERNQLLLVPSFTRGCLSDPPFPT